MSIIPKEGEEKEPVSLLGVIVAHYVLGLGILYLGQTTKNIMEFWAGLAVFLIGIGFIAFGIMSGADDIFYALMGVFSITTWLYIILRLIHIHMKKITKFKII